MNQLAEVIRILERSQDKGSRFIDAKVRGKGGDKISRLYQGIRSGSFGTDDAAAYELFQANPQDIRYATVKSRLKKSLVHTLVALNPKRAGYSDLTHQQYVCFRGRFLAQVLLLLGARNVSNRIALKILDKAREIELTTVQYDLLNQLRIDAAGRGRIAQFELYNAEIDRCLVLLEAENRAWQYYGRLDSTITKQQAPDETIKTLAIRYHEELKALAENATSITFRSNFYRVGYYRHLACASWVDLLEMCDEAIAYFSSKSATSAGISEFAFRKLDTSIRIKAYEKGKEALERGLPLLQVGSNNWFLFNLRYFLLLTHTGHFDDAHGLLDTILTHPRFESLPLPVQEGWKINELYLNWALEKDAKLRSKVKQISNDDRLEYLLNFAPTLSQDKQGHKVSLLILHILYLLEIGDFNGIIDRMEALRLYRARYLKAAQFPKTASFFKLLQIMENNSFSYKLVKEKGEKEYEKLIASTENQEEINEGLQILPYDWLWLKILDRLKEYEEKFNRRAL